MILVIPKIKLSNGKCNSHIIGEEGTNSLYNEFANNPCELLKLWRRENAKALYLHDYDSFTNEPAKCLDNIFKLTDIIDIPLTLYFNFETGEQASTLLDKGIYRIFLDRLLIENPIAVKELIEKYKYSRIAAYLDADDRYAYIPNSEKIPIPEYIELIQSLGISRIVYKNKNWEENLTDYDFKLLSDLAFNSKIRVTINGGVNDAAALLKVNQLSNNYIDSIIIGKALYKNNFPCQKIWRMVEAELEPDLICYSILKP